MKTRILAFTLGLVVATVAFADTKISALPAASALAGTETVPVVQSGATKGATINQIATKVLTGNAATATALASAPTACTAPQFATGISANGNSVGCAAAYSVATTTNIGGSALAAGACASGTVTTSGVTTSTLVGIVVTPQTYPGDGFTWYGYISATNTVTVKVCAIVAGTPTSSSYAVRVLF